MKSSIAIFIFLIAGFINAGAQLNIKQKTAVIDSLVARLNQFYVFPEVAKKMEAHLVKQLAKRQYDTVTDEKSFADLLSADLMKISNDRHLRVNYSAEVLPVQMGNPMELPEAEKAQYAKWLLSENYGIKKIEVLPGNIGYIDFKWFCGPEYAGDTYAAAMNYLNHTDALIIDLRSSNGAMSMHVIPFICSYFFEEPTHINDFYWRSTNQTVQTWTQTVVPGKKYLNKPLYILTSGKTFSGAEEFAYDLKNLRRAVLVGETTGGGANGGGSVRITDHYEAFIPNGRAINPITKTNWEGVGVLPDSNIKSNRALYKAQLMALTQVMGNSKDDMQKMYLKDMLAKLEQNPPSFKKITFSLAGFDNAKEVFVAGSFNNWSPTSDKLQRKGTTWITDAETEPGEVTYKFIVDGNWILDPNNSVTKADGPNTNSVKKVE